MRSLSVIFIVILFLYTLIMNRLVKGMKIATRTTILSLCRQCGLHIGQDLLATATTLIRRTNALNIFNPDVPCMS